MVGNDEGIEDGSYDVVESSLSVNGSLPTIFASQLKRRWIWETEEECLGAATCSEKIEVANDRSGIAGISAG